MKVLFPIGTIFPSQQGGPSNTVYWMAKALNTEGIEVTTVSTDLGVKDKTIQRDKWLDTDFGKVRYTTDRWHQLPFKLIFHTVMALKSVDVVHLTSIFYPPSWVIAIIIVVFRKTKIIWSVRGNFEKNALTYSNWKKKPIIFLIKFFLKKKVIFHTTSEVETQNTKALLGNDIKIIELPNYLELPQKLEKCKSTTREKYFLYMGRLHPIKALDNLIQALTLSEKFRASEFVFKIVGNGDKNYKISLEKMILELGLIEKVNLIGHIEGEEKQELYVNACFTFLVSHAENFGNVVVESLAQGTPVVASKGTPWQLLNEKKAGLWVNNSPKDLALAIDQILSINTTNYQELRENAILLCSDFDISKNIKKWIENVY